MSIELLFGQDIPAALCKVDCALVGGLSALMPNKVGRLSYLTGEGNHARDFVSSKKE